MNRRRALMTKESGSGPVYVDFTPVTYLTNPATVNHCGCVLGQTNSQVAFVEITINQTVSGDNIVFATTGVDEFHTTYPYFGSTNRGYNTNQSPVIGTITTIRATKTGTQSPSVKVRVGAWQDNTYTKKTEFYEVKIFNSNNVLIADYIPGYKTSTNKTGFYDILSDTFYPEATQSGWGFVRSSN